LKRSNQFDTRDWIGSVTTFFEMHVNHGVIFLPCCFFFKIKVMSCTALKMLILFYTKSWHLCVNEECKLLSIYKYMNH